MNRNLSPLQPQDDSQSSKEDESKLPGGCAISPNFLWLIVLLAMIPWLWGLFSDGFLDGSQISYTAFRQQVQEGTIEQVTVVGDQIRGTFTEPLGEETAGQLDLPPETTEFVTYLPSFGDDDLLARLEASGIEVETQPEPDSAWLTAILNFLPLILLVGLGFFFFRRMQSQGQNIMSIGKSRAQRHQKEAEQQTTFEDVAGSEGAKTELEEIIAFLKKPERFERLGGETPKGVLLVGPPGTGKTLLARAVSGEADAPFFSITGSDFMEMFVGVGASRVRDLFGEAKKAAPAIIFIDELDSIGRRRGAGLGGGHDEREQTLNQLLSELDGFEPNENVIVMAATNRPDILDPALLRPGRFDRQITVDLPTTKHRTEILEIHAKNKPIGPEVDLEEIARGTPGFSGADLQNMLNESALLAARKDKSIIELEDIEEARDKIMMGLKREGLALTDEECRLIAYHEAGHAVVAAKLTHADPIHKVTIVPRGRAMGVTQQFPDREKYVYSQEYMLDRLAVMMGGRAAENLVLETATSGAENDLKQATQLARKMILEWGMRTERLGRVAWGGSNQQVFLGEELTQRREYSESTAREIDEEIIKILDEAYTRAFDTLEACRDKLDQVAEALLEKEEILGKEVMDILDGAGPDKG